MPKIAQEPNLGQPVNRRVTAGDIHKAHLGVYFLDEFKTMSEQVAIRLLTALEDGELPIIYQGAGLIGGGTSALNVQTDPVPVVFFLLAAGNEDLLTDPDSILNRLPQFRNRFRYGRIIYMNPDMPDTLYTRMRVAQFVADEVFRFGLLPFDKTAVGEIINYLIMRSERKGRISLWFKYAIGIMKDASNLAKKEGEEVVTKKHVALAIKRNKSVEAQRLEKTIEKLRAIKVLKITGSEIGRGNGLVVLKSATGEEGVGDVFPLKVVMKKVESPEKGGLIITGITKTLEKKSEVEESIEMVRTAILKKYGIDMARDYYTHIDFVQQKDVDGPSAGIAVLLAVESILEAAQSARAWPLQEKLR